MCLLPRGRGPNLAPLRPPHLQSQDLVASQVPMGQARPGYLEGTLHVSSWGSSAHPGFCTAAPHLSGQGRSSCPAPRGSPWPAKRTTGHAVAPRVQSWLLDSTSLLYTLIPSPGARSSPCTVVTQCICLYQIPRPPSPSQSPPTSSSGKSAPLGAAVTSGWIPGSHPPPHRACP